MKPVTRMLTLLLTLLFASSFAPTAVFALATAPSGVTLSQTGLTVDICETKSVAAYLDAATVAYGNTWAAEANGAFTMVESQKEYGNHLVDIIGVKPGAGTVTVTTKEGFTATCAVTVVAPKLKTINMPKTLRLSQGKYVKLPVAALPYGAELNGLTFTSSNQAVARVNAKSGAVRAVKPGKTRITATSADGKLTAYCTVVVQARRVPLKSLKIKRLAGGVYLHWPYHLGAVFSPANATNAIVKWTSSRPDIATIDAAGTVTGHARGMFTITAESGGKRAKLKLTIG